MKLFSKDNKLQLELGLLIDEFYIPRIKANF